MVLHVFNPEHDIALAAHLSNFTAPHAGRQLRADLGYLPALWAGDSDAVLVDNAAYAGRCYARLRSRVGGGRPQFVEKQQLAGLPISRVEPWGWDLALCAQLRRYGVKCLPDEALVEQVRALSHRRTAARLLPMLRMEGTVGEAFECTSESEAEQLLERYGQVVLKAPWSSSGRGLRFLSLGRTPLTAQGGWFRNVVAAQGSVMVEPLCRKVKDFGMEFYADGDGVRYEGLSLFHTKNGAYIGNVVATERCKQQLIGRYIPSELLDAVREKICTSDVLNGYTGPFGVDMMVVAGNDGFLLHPCVEINVRRTMGHVALTFTPEVDDLRWVMRIELMEHYKLRIHKL